MDTKLRNNRESGSEQKGSRAVGILAVFLVLVLAAGTVYASYSLAYNRYQDYKADPKDMTFLANKIYRGNMVLYWELSEKIRKEYLNPSDVILPGYAQVEPTSERTTRPEASEQMQNNWETAEDSNRALITAILNQKIYEWKENMAEKLPNLYYCMIDHETGISVSNYEDLKELADASKVVRTSSLQESYRFVVRMELDAIGSPSVTLLHGAQMSEFLGNYKYNSLENNIWNAAGIYHFGPDYQHALQLPKDVTVLYAIPAQFIAADELYYQYEYGVGRSYLIASVEEALAAAYVFVVLCAVLLPFIRRLKLRHGLASRIPCEIAGVTFLFPLFMFDELSGMGSRIAAQELPDELMRSGLGDFMVQVLCFVINMAAMILVFGVLFLVVLSLHDILIHPIQYLKERTLTAKVFRAIARGFHAIGRKLKRAYKVLTDIDLNDSTDKLILKIVLINFCALALMCSIWVFGIGVLVAYSIILFLLLKKYAGDIRQKYAILLKATRQMSEGNLDVIIVEDLGLFNTLKYELEEIQTGFKRAVDEEVKSQNMKTELITNVSHDLKTPLTAIITYIDLMKDPTLSEEERKQYLDTLDRKAGRLKTLIEDLFEVSKAASRNVTLTLVDVDLCALLKQVEFELSDKIAEAGIEFRFRLPEEKVILRLDSQKTYRIFENLMINITKYALPGTRAYVDVTDMGDRVMVVLKNVSRDELNFDTTEITERFVRGDKSRNTEGSGLGLAIVKSFTELQGGTFEILADGDLFKAVVWVWK